MLVRSWTTAGRAAACWHVVIQPFMNLWVSSYLRFLFLSLQWNPDAQLRSHPVSPQVHSSSIWCLCLRHVKAGEREDDRGSCGQSGRLFRAGVTHTRARHNKSIVKSTHKYDVISTVTEKWHRADASRTSWWEKANVSSGYFQQQSTPMILYFKMFVVGFSWCEKWAAHWP